MLPWHAARPDRHLVGDRGRRLPADVRAGRALRGVRHPPPRDRRLALRARGRGGATPADPGRQRPRSSRRRRASRSLGRGRHGRSSPAGTLPRPLRRARARRPRCCAAHDAGAPARVACAPGAFALAATGLLDGRRATTHWMHAEELAARYPPITVDPSVLYVDEGSILTSAGTAAGIDLCLHLVRRDLGAEAANTVARRMVVPPHRDGGQAQFVQTPGAARRRGRSARPGAHVDGRAPRRAADGGRAGRAGPHVSPRTFARRFVERHRHHADPVAAHPAGAAGPRSARDDRPAGRADRPRVRVLAPAPACAPTSSGSSAPPRPSTAALRHRARARPPGLRARDGGNGATNVIPATRRDPGEAHDGGMFNAHCRSRRSTMLDGATEIHFTCWCGHEGVLVDRAVDRPGAVSVRPAAPHWAA